MLGKQNLIRTVSEQIKMITDRIEAIENHNTDETMEEVSELYKEKRMLELFKCDLEDGTHLVDIEELERRIDVQSAKIDEAKNRYYREKLLHNHKGMRRETRKMRIAHNKMKIAQVYLNYLYRKDNKRGVKKRKHTL